jgi:hypothetical protein
MIMAKYFSTKSLRVSLLCLSAGLLACRPQVQSDSTQEKSPTQQSVLSLNGATPTGHDIVGENGVGDVPIPAGYYNGNQRATLSDTDLKASNIAAGVTLFGVTGNLVAESHSNCSANGGINCISTASFTAGAPQANVTATAGSRVTTIPKGYYDGTKSITFSDSKLVPGNITAGVNIFGVTGTATLTSGNCTSNGQTGCTATGPYVAATPAASNFNGTNGARTITPPAGYYDGLTKTVTANDTNLIAANILSGKTIFGVSGTATGALPVCTDNVLNVQACTTSANRYVGTPVTSPVVGPQGALSFPIPAGYYNGGKSCIGTEMDLRSYNIKAGVVIFGVTGTASCTSTLSASGTTGGEATSSNLSLVSSSQTDVPAIQKDTDGFEGANGASSDFHPVNRTSFVNCGNAQNTLSARIADCAALNGANAVWNGETNVGAGQGTWKLVTRSAPNQEVWQDQRTGLLWSSVLSSNENWCRASGNAEASDPNGYCNSTTFQPSYPTAQSWCAESGPTTMKEVAGSGENWASGIYHPSKGGMGATSTASSPSVHWRSPTRNDYELAEIDGIRFVLPDMLQSSSANEWTATVVAANRENSWQYSGQAGGLMTANRSGTSSVRCVGR